MKLAKWLKRHKLNPTKFAKMIGRHQPTIYRYVNGERIPEPDIMQEIYSATRGEVSPNDFYDLQRRA